MLLLIAEFRENRLWEFRIAIAGFKWNYIYWWAVKLCEILKVKIALVKTV
jgi:hypothetical protein